MPRIFISYRRDDSAMAAGRLYDHLSAHFSDKSLFMDIDTIEPGEDFVEVLQNAVGSCQALIAVIGPDWLSIADEMGRRRLDDPNDFVRLEIAAALERNIRVIPVLVDGASMPLAVDLPDDLAKLARRNALFISNERFRYDAAKLIETLDRVLQSESASAARADQPATKVRALPESQGAIRAVTQHIKAIWGPTLLTAIGWAVGAAVLIYILYFDPVNLSALTIGGSIGGLATGLALRWRIPTFRVLPILMLAVGWGVALTGAGLLNGGENRSDLPVDVVTIGMAVGGLVAGLAIYWQKWATQWKRIVVVSVGWAAGSIIAGAIVNPVIPSLSAVNDIVAWVGVFGAAVGAIGGGVMFWQLRSTHPHN
jgi:hypothetical protein